MKRKQNSAAKKRGMRQPKPAEAPAIAKSSNVPTPMPVGDALKPVPIAQQEPAGQQEMRQYQRRPLGLARVAFFIMLALVLATGCFAYALLHTPAWYTPPIVAPHERQRVRNNLLEAEQAFTESLMAGGPFIYHLFAEDINRWIAMRKEIYPLIDELAPPLLEEPVVVFGDGVITLAGRYRVRDADAVLSVDIEPRFTADAIVLTVSAVRCGSVRMPRAFGGLGMDRTIERERNRTWPGSPRMWGDFFSGFHVGAEAWWKNGGIDYRVTGLSVEAGRLNLEVTPLGRQSDRQRNDQRD